VSAAPKSPDQKQKAPGCFFCRKADGKAPGGFVYKLKNDLLPVLP